MLDETITDVILASKKQLLFLISNFTTMSKANDALRQTIEKHNISQSQLAEIMGIEGAIVSNWYHSQVDPRAETVAEIVRALKRIGTKVAEDFIRFYLDLPTQPGQDYLVCMAGSELPASEVVDVSTLSGLFTQTTNSYKYLFFISLLDILKRQKFNVLSPIGFGKIAIEILANTWYPSTYCKLSFGISDRLPKMLSSLKLDIGKPILKFTDTDKNLLRKTIGSQNLSSIVFELLRYVPFRLIMPFVEAELENIERGIRGKGMKADYTVPRIATEYFDLRSPYINLTPQFI